MRIAEDVADTCFDRPAVNVAASSKGHRRINRQRAGAVFDQTARATQTAAGSEANAETAVNGEGKPAVVVGAAKGQWPSRGLPGLRRGHDNMVEDGLAVGTVADNDISTNRS